MTCQALRNCVNYGLSFDTMGLILWGDLGSVFYDMQLLISIGYILIGTPKKYIPMEGKRLFVIRIPFNYLISIPINRQDSQFEHVETLKIHVQLKQLKSLINHLIH